MKYLVALFIALTSTALVAGPKEDFNRCKDYPAEFNLGSFPKSSIKRLCAKVIGSKYGVRIDYHAASDSIKISK
jgi:hypothetical protein